MSDTWPSNRDMSLETAPGSEKSQEPLSIPEPPPPVPVPSLAWESVSLDN